MKKAIGATFFVWTAVIVSQVSAQNGAKNINSGLGKRAIDGSDPSDEPDNYINGNLLYNSMSRDGLPYYYLAENGNDYKFKYKVDDGNQYFGQEEVRQGDVVMGGYFVRLPDGRLQEVTYVADQNGSRVSYTYRVPAPGSQAPPYDRDINYVPPDAE